MSMELKDKMRGCMSENLMFLQWGELRKGERSSRATNMLKTVPKSGCKTHLGLTQIPAKFDKCPVSFGQ